jgi:integrase
LTLPEAGYPEKGTYQHRKALAVLTAHHKTVGELDRKTVGIFVSDVLAQGRKAATANRIISTYSALWRWLERRGHVEGNPWLNQRLATKGDNGDRRAFTELEAKAFLSSLEGVDRDVVSVAAVTGMRLEEITGLEPADVTAKGKVVWLEVRQGKTKAAARRVPVVAPAVRKMLLDRKAAGHAKLFHELKPDRFGDYGSALSKRVGRKLRSIGLTDPHLVADHSWRHRARTLMEHAGVMPWVADAVIGHKRPGEGLGRYSKGPSDEQLTSAVKTIPLP